VYNSKTDTVVPDESLNAYYDPNGALNEEFVGMIHSGKFPNGSNSVVIENNHPPVPITGKCLGG